MSKELISQLAELAAAAQQHYERAAKIQGFVPARFRASPKILEALAGEIETSGLLVRDRMFFSTLNGKTQLSSITLAQSMAERVINGVPPAQAFQDVCSLFTPEKNPVYALIGLTGVTAEQVINFSENVRILPPGIVPPTYAREMMFDLDKDGKRIYRGLLKEHPPSAALIIDQEAVIMQGLNWDNREHKRITDDVAVKQDWVLTALTLAGEECAPFAVSSTSWADHPACAYEGFGSGYAKPPITPTVRNGKPDPQIAIKVYADLQKLKEDDWLTIFRAGERLRRSRSHSSNVNQAIDLGIALEMIFLHDLKDRGELQYRTAIRGAWLLGKSGSQRQDIFKSLKKAYQARSQAVHTGKLTDQSLIDNLPVADRYCAEAIKAIAHNAGFPKNWEALVLDDNTI